ncbi:uncharacterized protein LOC134761919 isoform X4 [Pongo abelii]|uniref:uncharacterized protein LOC134761919 isoform X4 n=1 Tax=Pongo abelii TaxID=9601 RepID=UPI0030068276
MKPQRVAGAEWDPKSSPWRAATTVPGAWGVLDRFRLKKQRMSEMPSVGCGSGRGKQAPALTSRDSTNMHLSDESWDQKLGRRHAEPTTNKTGI